MKKLLFTLALIINAVFVFATDGKMIVRATADNVKMYRQAGTSSPVVKSLKSSDEITIIRKHNANWTLVSLDGEVGYVVTSELTNSKTPKLLIPEKGIK